MAMQGKNKKWLCLNPNTQVYSIDGRHVHRVTGEGGLVGVEGRHVNGEVRCHAL